MPSKSTKKNTLKILYIGNFDKLSVGEPEVATSLETLGHRVTRLQERETSPEEIEARLKKREYSMLLFTKLRYGSAGTLTMLRRAKDMGVPTVTWMWDLYWGYRPVQQIRKHLETHFQAEYVFTSDGGNDDKWKKHGINHFTLRQGIMQGTKRGSPVYNTTAEIGFIGTMNTWAGWTYRTMLMQFLAQNYPDKFVHFGLLGEVKHEELNNLIATLKIVIGDSVYSPHYWSNRIYEMIGRGAFLITPKVPGLEKEYTYGEHFVPYALKDFDSLRRKIDYYLEHDDEREGIATAGYDYTHKRHTYLQRTEELLRILREQNAI